MAAPNADATLVAAPPVTGGILTAATGTTLPTDTTTALSSFTATGYTGEDGVELTIDRQTQDVYAWGGSKIRVITTSHSVQLAFEFATMDLDALPLIFGSDNVTTSGSTTTIKLNSDTLPHFALVVAAADGDKAVRITAADAQVVNQDAVTFTHTDTTRFPVTVECFPDDNGDKAKIIYDDGTESSS